MRGKFQVPLLELKDVRFSYDKAEVLRGVSCSFDEGGLSAIIGKSGSGKSTLLALMAGIETPASGEVLFRGEAVGKSNLLAYRRKNISVIYQNFRLFPLMTALENIMYPLELRHVPAKQAKERAIECMEAVDLSLDYVNRFPSMLSGGEQQRVAIARALAAETPLILADEPTGNLDTQSRDIIIGILAKLARERNHCVILVTHDSELLQHADAVHRMRDGMFVS